MRQPFVHKLSVDEIRSRISGRQWFHNFDFGEGVTTRGRDPSYKKLAALSLPDLNKKSVIDVGAYDGFFAFEAERRGASHVVANDDFVWRWPGSPASENFNIVKEILSSRVEKLVLPVEELNAETAGNYDVVLFLGVLYHAPDPIGYLKNIFSITKDMLVLETMVDLENIDVPALAFYPGATRNNDATNHFGPNQLAVRGMLEKVGFRDVTSFGLWSIRDRNESGEVVSGRAVFHAWK